jgi:hypothetical protein
MDFCDKDFNYIGKTAKPSESRFITVQECFRDLIGGSTTIAWRTDFVKKLGGFHEIPGLDIYLPFMAILDKGAYFLLDSLQTYVQHADVNNTGLEGVWRAADDDGKMQLEELMQFQSIHGLYTIVGMLNKLGIENTEATEALCEHIFQRTASWQNVRARMAMKKLPPLALRV